jgi:hypothetical protein
MGTDLASKTAPQPPPPPRASKFRSLLAYIFLPQGKPGEIVIISHSHLFYWWPVWLVGFIMAGLTAWDGTYMAIVPNGTKPATNLRVADEKGNIDPAPRKGYLLREDKTLLTRTTADGTEAVIRADVGMAKSKNYGIVYVVVLLLVIFITNVPLRGIWSVFIIIVIFMLSIIFALSGIWDILLSRAKLLAIHINLGGYLFLSIAVFAIWLINFFFFDRQFYMIFTPGQVRVHLEIGAGETVYDTGGMVFQKQRSDLFRHWILGFGSGDLIVRPAGGVQHIDLPNVLSVGRRVREIEKKLAEKEVIAA